MRPSLQYCLFFNSSTTISAWQHIDQENPHQMHLIFGWVELIMTFLPSILSHSFSRESHIWKWSRFCAGGIVMPACCLCLFHQDTMILCLPHSWTHIHHTPRVTKMQPVTLFWACTCVVNNVDWTVLQVEITQWNPAPALPSPVEKVVMKDAACWPHEIHRTGKAAWWSALKGTFVLQKEKILDINELAKGIWIKTEFHSNKWTKLTAAFLLFRFQERRHTNKTFPIHVRASTWHELREQDYSQNRIYALRSLFVHGCHI